MGRKKKYLTEEQLTLAKRKTAMRYYWKHAKKRRKAALERYYKKSNKK